MSPVAKPRDAASLVAVRVGREPAVLMGRRHARHRFMPNYFVFPGGRVDPRDHLAPLVSDLRSDVAEALSREVSPVRARALAVAAARETFEETGLVLGELRDGRLAPALDGLQYLARAITPVQSPIRFHARFFVVAEAALGGQIRDSDELLDVDWVPVSRALALPLADITQFVVHEVARLVPDLTAKRSVPLYRYRRGRPSVVRHG